MPEYIVVEGHTLGYRLPNGRYGVLHASMLKGAVFDMYPDSKILPRDKKQVRPATRQDFRDFRVLCPPDFAD